MASKVFHTFNYNDGYRNQYLSRKYKHQSINTLAIKGDLLGIIWLHKNRTDRREGCTTAAMDMAASNGHLEVVEWLHENRTDRREGCRQYAMDMAASNGYLDVMKWLHLHYSLYNLSNE